MMYTPKIEYLRDITKRVEEIAGCVCFSDIQWFGANARELWREIEYLQKLTTAEVVLANMEAMVRIADPETQAAMQQLRDRLEIVTAERDLALAKADDLDKRLAARDGFSTQEACDPR